MDEVTENRKLLPFVIKYLRECGHEVQDVTPSACDTNTDLAYGVNNANNWGADLFVSLHFNKAYNSYNGAIGSEVCVYSQFDKAQRVCDKLGALGFINRGQKIRQELYELRNTTMEAMIIEVCFLEATEDVNLYQNLGPDKVGRAIAEAIANKTIEAPPEPQQQEGEMYRVRKSWSDASTQIGAYTNLENAKKVCTEGYNVYDSNGNCVYSNSTQNTNYTVKITADVLNVRVEPNTNSSIATTVKQNEVYTIVETDGNWGKLKSGAGWICLDYTVKC